MASPTAEPRRYAKQNKSSTSDPLQTIHAPEAPVPLGKYSQAIISGDMVYLSGQLGQDPTTGKIVAGGIEAQTNQVIHNVEACLIAAGSSLSKIVSRRTYVTDIQAHLGPVSAAWAKVITEPYPSATLVQVGALALKEALVEIEVMAEMLK